MTPEAARYLDTAREKLRQAAFLVEQAETVSNIGLPDAAGRAAYLAGFHAAQAFLFETTGQVFKTHSGVRGEFGRLTKNDPRFDLAARAFLGRTYDLKIIADYETGEAKVTTAQAAEAIAAARLFLACVAHVLGGTSP